MNLLSIDIGNTNSKAAVYSEGRELAFSFGQELNLNYLEEWKSRYNIRHAAISAVADDERLPLAYLERHFELYKPNAASSLPFRVFYRTPQTLGTDRLACMAAAHALYPGRNVLVLQCGTCLTVDLLTADAVYQGGSIAPGLYMRFKALNAFTSRLPMLAPEAGVPLVGQTTETAIQAGVLHGFLSECEGLIRKYNAEYEDIIVILTGGDAELLQDKIKMTTFAFPNLVLYGLMTLLKYDIEKE